MLPAGGAKSLCRWFACARVAVACNNLTRRRPVPTIVRVASIRSHFICCAATFCGGGVSHIRRGIATPVAWDPCRRARATLERAMFFLPRYMRDASRPLSRECRAKARA